MITRHLTVNDLMIGDWVKVTDDDSDKWFFGIVCGIDRDNVLVVKPGHSVGYPYAEECLEPIPIAPKILEKNGFYCSQRDKYHAFLRRETFEVELKKSTSIAKVLGIKRIGNMGYTRKSYNLPLPTFVHELQHALKLCGIEKEIIL